MPPQAQVETIIQASTRQPESLWRKVRIEAIRRGVTIHEFVRGALEAALTVAPAERKRSGRNGGGTE